MKEKSKWSIHIFDRIRSGVWGCVRKIKVKGPFKPRTVLTITAWYQYEIQEQPHIKVTLLFYLEIFIRIFPFSRDTDLMT